MEQMTANENRTLTEQLTRSLAVTHSRHAWRVPQTSKTIGKPAEWIEPLRSRDDAISEAKRIAEEESIFGCGCAWFEHGKWWAADARPQFADGEIVTIEIKGAA
jgi:hypothetical protein